jgi:hypothetical protein
MCLGLSQLQCVVKTAADQARTARTAAGCWTARNWPQVARRDCIPCLWWSSAWAARGSTTPNGQGTCAQSQRLTLTPCAAACCATRWVWEKLWSSSTSFFPDSCRERMRWRRQASRTLREGAWNLWTLCAHHLTRLLGGRATPASAQLRLLPLLHPPRAKRLARHLPPSLIQLMPQPLLTPCARDLLWKCGVR